MFYQIDDYFGVDVRGTPPSIMVPLNDFNLIVHDFGPNAFRSPPDGLTILDITDDLKATANAAQKLSRVLGGAADLKNINDRLAQAKIKAPNLGGSRRLVAITSKLKRDFTLTVGSQTFVVAVRGPRKFNVSFWVFTYTGEKDVPGYWPGISPGVDDAWGYVNALNSYFYPQANIVFDIMNARAWERDAWPDAGFSKKSAREIGPTMIDRSADWTIFVVPYVNLVDSEGSAFSGDATWIPFAPSSLGLVAGLDSFIATLGHEMVHALAKKSGLESDWHSTRGGTICNRATPPSRAMLIDKPTLDVINPIAVK